VLNRSRSSVLTVAILGAGNGGCAAAADLTLRGFRVRLFNRTAARLEPIAERGGLVLTGAAGDGFARLDTITDKLDEALAGAELIIITAPTSALTYYAPALASLVKPDQVIFLNPGHVGGGLFVANEFRRHSAITNLRLCETTSLTYACRMQDPTTIMVYTVATNLLFASFPGDQVEHTFDLVRTAFPQVTKANDVLETAMQDLNAVEHPAQILCNAGWVEHTSGDFYFYYEGTTPSVARVIEAVDAERLDLANAIGVPTKSFVEYFFEAGYTSRDALLDGSVYAAMQASAPNRWIKGPRNLDHRYIHEDVGWGLVPWLELARVFGASLPIMGCLTDLAGVMNRVDYRTAGLTLERMGLSGLSRDQIREYVSTGALTRAANHSQGSVN
jgi:opine dehydrogenase